MTTKQKPAHEIRLGSVKAALWCNRTEKSGTFYSVTFTRSYKSGNDWKRSDSFGRDELPLLKTAAEMAFEWIEALAKTEPVAAQAEPTETQPNI